MAVEFARDGDVAVGVEAGDEFGALVAEVGLGGEVVGGGWGAAGVLGQDGWWCGEFGGSVELGVGEDGAGGWAGGLGRGVEWVVAGWDWWSAICGRGMRCSRALVSVVVDCPMLVGWGAGMGFSAVDGLPLRAVGSVATKSGFERVSATVRQEC